MRVAIGKRSAASPITVLAALPIAIVLGIPRRVAIVCLGGANSKKTVLVQATFGVNEVSAAIGKHATVLMWRPAATIWIAGLIGVVMRRCAGSMNSAIPVFTTAIAPLKVYVRSNNALRVDLYTHARLCTESSLALG